MFTADKRALIISFAVPVVIASFMATLTASMNSPKEVHKVSLLVVDQDESTGSKAIVARLQKSESINVELKSLADAQSIVEKGNAPLAVVFPKGFAEGAMNALKGGTPTDLKTITDPTKNVEAQIGLGLVTQSVMRVVVPTLYGTPPGQESASSDAAFSVPYKASELVAKTERKSEDQNQGSSTAHAFAGMAVQGLLFWSIEAGMGLLRERRLGLWRRLRSAPITPAMVLLGKILSGSIRALAILVVVFGFGALVFHFKISGSLAGFVLIAAASALMASTFGLVVAALGKTEEQSRGLSVLAVLGMLMLGGAWFPSFLMPASIQNLAKATPASWAVNGFDAMTWRAQGLTEALPFALALCVFAVIFAAVSLRRMSFEIAA